MSRRSGMKKGRRKTVGFPSDSKGAVAVEFALIAPVFLMLVLSVLELGWTMTRIALIDNAVAQAAKFVYIGAASSGSPTQTALEAFICDEAMVISNCYNNITVELTTINDFHSPPAWNAPCVDSDDVSLAPVVGYSPGAGGSIMFMRVCVTMDLFTPGLGMGLALQRTNGGRTQIISSLAFMNEPF